MNINIDHPSFILSDVYSNILNNLNYLQSLLFNQNIPVYEMSIIQHAILIFQLVHALWGTSIFFKIMNIVYFFFKDDKLSLKENEVFKLFFF